MRHVALELIHSAVSSGLVDVNGLLYLRESLMAYLRQYYGATPEPAAELDSTVIQNKLAYTFTSLFSIMYDSAWASFFDDILAVTYSNDSSAAAAGAPPNNVYAIIFYLRVVNTIHEEIGDLLVIRSREDQDKANHLKDLIRERDAQKLVDSWQTLIAHFQTSNNVVTELCLRAIGSYVGWIDISLVVNQSMVNLLLQQLARTTVQSGNGNEKLRDTAINVFTETVSKKMKPSDKLALIAFLNIEGIVSQLSNTPSLNDQTSSDTYDCDLAETVARLVNMAAFDIVKVLDSDQADSTTKANAEGLLHSFLPHILRFFSDKNNEVCLLVVPCLSELLTYLRRSAQRNPAIADSQAPILLPILKAIISKMRYGEDDEWDDEDVPGEENDFQEVRKRLNSLQQVIANTNQTLFMDAITDVVRAMFENMKRAEAAGTVVDWKDLDLALHEMYLFGDMAMRGGSIYTKGIPNSPAAERLAEMMRVMVEAHIRCFNHPCTQLAYMELCVRYASFLDQNQHTIPVVLEKLLSFAHHPVPKVKLRSWYLFYRLVKHLRGKMGNVAETVIMSLRDVLVIQAELPSDADGANGGGDTGFTDTIFQQQLYLFEAIGALSSMNAVPAEQQAYLARSVIAPIFSDMEANLAPAKAHNDRALQQMHHDIMALGTLARGFSDWMPGMSASSTWPSQTTLPLAPEVSDAFGQVSEATLTALEALNFSPTIRAASRATFARLIGVRGAKTLPELPRWIDGLATGSVEAITKDELAQLLRLQHQLIYGFKGEIQAIMDSRLTPFLLLVFTRLSAPITGTDDAIQSTELKREFLNFILAMLNYDLAPVIISMNNQTILEPVITKVEEYAKDASDLPTAKLALSTLCRMSVVWGGEDIISSDNKPISPTPAENTSPIPGFGEFMITHFSPLCWSLPTNPSFSRNDAQGKQALGEVAILQKTIYNKLGPKYVQWLTEQELPGLGMSAELASQYVAALTGNDVKGFKTYFQV